MARIATEQLVAAVARQRDLHSLTRQRRDQAGRQLRGIGERLVVILRDAWQQRAGVIGLDVELSVLGAKMSGDPGGVARLVVPVLAEPDREGPHRALAPRLHQGRHRRTVDAARQHRPERDVGNHASAHRVAEQRLELVGCLAVGNVHRLRRTGGGDRTQVPVPTDPRFLPRSHGQDMTGQELLHAAVDRRRSRDMAESQVPCERVPVDDRRPPGMRSQRLELGAEEEEAVEPAPVQRLDAEPITNQVECPLAPVPEREREHPDQCLQRRLQAPCGHRASSKTSVSERPRKVAPSPASRSRKSAAL